jgi:hypothetical protein
VVWWTTIVIVFGFIGLSVLAMSLGLGGAGIEVD